MREESQEGGCERERERERGGRRQGGGGGGKQTGNVHLLLHIHLLIFDTLGRQTFLHVLHGIRHHLGVACALPSLSFACVLPSLNPSLNTPCPHSTHLAAHEHQGERENEMEQEGEGGGKKQGERREGKGGKGGAVGVR
jgi:hypothetical protein